MGLASLMLCLPIFVWEPMAVVMWAATAFYMLECAEAGVK